MGLHSGEKVFLTLNPAAPNTGIVFSRTDLTPNVEIRAHACNVVDTTLATTLGEGEVRIATVEHLMSALAGLGVDNALAQFQLDNELVTRTLPVRDGRFYFDETDETGTYEVQVAGMPHPTTVNLFDATESAIGADHGR